MNALGYSALGFNSKRKYGTVDIDYARIKKLRVGADPNTYLLPEAKGNAGDVLTMQADDTVLWEPVTSNEIFESVIWKPGSVSHGNSFHSWAEIVAQINSGVYNVIVDDSIISPAVIDLNVDGKSRLVFRPYRTVFGHSVQVVFGDPVTLANVAGAIGPINF